MTKISTPKGVRDFNPEVLSKRKFIIRSIEEIFQKYAFQELETPALENLEVLTGKYGQEGDQLIFKILNSGDYLKSIEVSDLSNGYKKMTPRIAEKALRYDLTIPFARFVAMNQGKLLLPFKRYQIQPVWRGDNPQKGRYREFYQCDADVIGTDSLLCELDIILMINEVFEKLGIKNFSIKINHRKILTGMAQLIGAEDKASELFVIIDKLDKIGVDQVVKELVINGFSEEAIQKLMPFFRMEQDKEFDFEKMRELLNLYPTGLEGLADLEKTIEYLTILAPGKIVQKEFNLDFSTLLARGLSYYTGAIFEVKVHDVQIGSVSGGGRYDNLTGSFGVPNVSGVGISFGIDRLYDVLEALNLFPKNNASTSTIMFVNFDSVSEQYLLPILYNLRKAGIKAEFYPEPSKLKKQMAYANGKNIPFVAIAGSDEIEKNVLSLKNMQTGDQGSVTVSELIERLKISEA